MALLFPDSGIQGISQADAPLPEGCGEQGVSSRVSSQWCILAGPFLKLSLTCQAPSNARGGIATFIDQHTLLVTILFMAQVLASSKGG